MAAYTTIDDSEAHFQAVLWTGNGSANNAITLPGDTDMQPDLVIIKNRDAADDPRWFDAIRGATWYINPGTASSGYAVSTEDTDTLDSFTSDGFQVDADVTVNTNTEKYVAWCWKAGGSTASNSTGDITSTVSVNTTAGFALVKYSGNETDDQDIGHSLGAVPKFMIFKTYSATNDWSVYHASNTSAPETDHLVLNRTNATADQVTMFSDEAPTSSVFTVGVNQDTNRSSSNNTICYCWTDIQGFSKFGVYEGNNNADGPFIYCGFRPAMVLIKAIDTTGPWVCVDNKRIESGSNFDNAVIFWNETTVEQSTNENHSMNLLSNGFKLTSADDWTNDPETYVFAAWAHSPFVNSSGVPNNAR